MFSRANGRVLIDISEEEYTSLLFMMGYAIGAQCDRELPPKRRNERDIQVARWLQLANSINEGNASWTPYEIDPLLVGREQSQSKPSGDGGQNKK